MTRMVVGLAGAALAAMLGTACATVRRASDASAAPVWPPRNAESPGELVWFAEVGELEAAGLSGFLRAVAGADEGPSRWRLMRPTAVALVGDLLAVADAGVGEVVLSRRDGSRARRLPLPAGFVPVAVAGAGKTLLVADGPTGEVLSLSTEGHVVRRVAPPSLVSRAGGVAACADGSVLITDVAAGAVLRVSPAGVVAARTGSRGSGPGEFNFPTAVIEAPDGTVWVLDALNFRVQHLGADLEPLGSFGELGDGSGHFALPKGLAMDGEGHLYVSDARFDNIQVFDAEGRLLFVAGARGTGPGELWNPGGLAFGPDGTLAVADSGNGRVQLLQYRRRTGVTPR